MTLLIIAANVGVFFYLRNLTGGGELIETLILSPANLFSKGRITCIITAGFLHKDMYHLMFNCLGIFIFGSIVEKHFGSLKTLMVYFGALILSMLFSIIIYTFILEKNIAIMGASGALMGLMACAMLISPFEITYETIVPIPVMFKGWMFIYADMRGFLGGEVDGISHLAHLLGFISIAVMVYFLSKEERNVLTKGLVINIISVAIFLGLSKTGKLDNVSHLLGSISLSDK